MFAETYSSKGISVGPAEITVASFLFRRKGDGCFEPKFTLALDSWTPAGRVSGDINLTPEAALELAAALTQHAQRVAQELQAQALESNSKTKELVANGA